ncbi:MAG: SGNH/GDSL hydrolase family protein [Deltaproteobacteria bacterium]|nr:SGNH/GDSL hydrolase family protein [Deltaproteobacteria bacterium]
MARLAAIVWAGLTVLHVGDSQVSGGLTAGLRSRIHAEGGHYVASTWVSSSVRQWLVSRRLGDLLRQHQPDVVMITLGSNEQLYPNLDQYGEHVRRLVRRFAGRRCFMIGPPRWRVSRVDDVQAANSAPCPWFDSRPIEAPRGGRMRAHFTYDGGELWARAIWDWMNALDPPPVPQNL